MKGKLKVKGLGNPIQKKAKLREEKEKVSLVEKVVTSETTISSKKDTSSSNNEIQDKRTEAERAFAKAQKKREKDRVAKLAAKPYRERVEQMNKRLSELSEHYDIPKVARSCPPQPQKRHPPTSPGDARPLPVLREGAIPEALPRATAAGVLVRP